MTDAAVDQAFANGEILRTHVMRPTWHFVTPEDIRWLLALIAPRVRAAMAYMNRQIGLDKAAFKKSNTVLTKAFQGNKQLTRSELRDPSKSGHSGRRFAPGSSRVTGRIGWDHLQRTGEANNIHMPY